MWTFKKRVPEIQAQTLSTYTLFAKPVSKNENVHDSVPFVHQLIGYQTSPDPSRNTVGKSSPTLLKPRSCNASISIAMLLKHVHTIHMCSILTIMG